MIKISEQWLKTWVNYKMDPQTIAHLLTMGGLEVGILPVSGHFQSVVVAEIIETKPHPQAERLTLCLVHDGQNTPYQVVCGALNVRAGLKVALAKVGATLPQDVVIQETHLRGQLSRGMLCSSKELGLSEQSEGIMELPQDAPVGQALFHYLKCDDRIFDIEITPNRGDCLSLRGIARELAAKIGVDVVTPDIPLVQTGQAALPVTVQIPEACPWYVGCLVKKICQNETPLWMKERLRRAGIRSLHPVVDVTQYVMLELGQPMHAFHVSAIEGGVIVRKSIPGETLTLLDGQTITLKENTIVIADHHKPLALAGLMGGIDSAVEADSTDIFLESVFFTPQALSGTAKQYGLMTDAAYRYERGVDPHLPLIAMQRALNLLQDIVPGDIGQIISVKQARSSWFQPKTVHMRPTQFQRMMGITMPEETMQTILQRLGFKLIVKKDHHWQFEIPSYRFDVEQEIDLLRELMRLKGYDTLPTTPTTTILRIGQKHPLVTLEEQAHVSCQALGYREIISYSFVDPRLQNVLFPHQNALMLANPLSPELSAMRVSLWPGLIAAMLYNVRRQQTSIALFECGHIFDMTSKTLQEHMVVAGLLAGWHGSLQWAQEERLFDFYDLKGDVEVLCRLWINDPIQFVPKTHEALHPGQSACLMHQNHIIGWCGALHPTITQALDVPYPVLVFECWLEKLPQVNKKFYQVVSKYPKIRRDLALLVKDTLLFSDLEQAIKTVDDHGILKSIQIFDIYQGEGIPAGKKSIAIALILQSLTQTLQDNMVQDYVKRLVGVLHQKLGIILRDGHDSTQ